MIWLQIITAFFAIACAWLNRWPVNLMRRYGMPGKGAEREFHTANAAVKVLYVIAALVTSDVSFSTGLIFSPLLLLIQWLVFDPALNLLTGKPWHYLGQTAMLDRLVKNGFIKALVVLVLIIALNFFL